MKEKTPKQQFIDLLNNSLEEIHKIDKATPYQSDAPDWWIDMIDLGRSIHKILEKHK